MAYEIYENILYIFTDGASRRWLWNKPARVGGMWIYFVYFDESWYEIQKDMSDYIGRIGATNNDMELQAAINWLKIANKMYDITPLKKIMIITDSEFVSKNRKNAYYGNRSKNNWKTFDKDPVIHKQQRKDLIKLIRDIIYNHKKWFDMDWVKGHSDDENNKRADKAAVQWALSPYRIKGSNSWVRKPFFKNAKRFKSKDWKFIPHKNKKIYIHVYAGRDLWNGRWQRMNYEVVSLDSDYFMFKWRLYHQRALSAEFIYLVELADDWSHKIINILEQITKPDMRKKIIESWLYENNIFYGENKESK